MRTRSLRPVGVMIGLLLVMAAALSIVANSVTAHGGEVTL
jgi:hypothetical protein